LTPALVLSFAAAAWWLGSTAVLLLSFFAALLFPLRRCFRSGNALPPLTAIVPVKNLHDGFGEAQRSLFAQDYARLEIMVAAADPESAALSTLRNMRGGIAPRFIISDCTSAASPKLNNVWPAISQAKNDLILTKDSNTVLPHPGDLAALVARLGSDTGLVSAIPIARQVHSFPAWIEVSIINSFHARVLMLADALGLGFGLGKIMLFRRSDLLRSGGFDALKWAVGEDMAVARAMRRLGLRTVLADRTCDQILGSRSFDEVWQRQLRWMTIWRVQLPAAFVANLFGSALPTALAGAVSARLFGMSPATSLVITLAGWCTIESLLCILKGWPVSLWSPLAFLARELLTPVLWLSALTTNNVQWAGATYQVHGHRAPNLSVEHDACTRSRVQ